MSNNPFIFSKHFILLRVTVGMELIVGTLGMKWKHTLNGTVSQNTRHNTLTPRGNLEESVYLLLRLFVRWKKSNTDTARRSGSDEKALIKATQTIKLSNIFKNIK